jgi:hypothetical protein
MPEAFTAAVVSNAMALGGFKMKDFSKGENPMLKDDHLIRFFKKNEAGRPQSLFIAPTLGAMLYRSERDNSAPIEDVPSPEETEALARDVLFKLGIDSSLVFNPRNGYDEVSTRLKYDRETHKTIPPGVTVTTMRGVSFQRRIDGIQESRAWSFLIHFRSHGEIEDFSLFWRNLLPDSSHVVLTPDQMVAMIKSGRTSLPPQYYDLSGLGQAKRLTVVKVTPEYFSGSGGEPLVFLHPFADLEMNAETGGTNTVTFALQAPILADDLPKSGK